MRPVTFAPTTVIVPADERDEFVNEKMFVPAVVPLIRVSQPVPILIADEVKLPESVTLAMFTP